MMSRAALGAALTAAVLAAVAPAYAAGAGDARQCFRSHDYQGFRPVDDHSFIIRVEVNDYYRIETEDACPELLYPEATLVTVVRGSDLICGPLDWDLRVGQSGEPGGFATGCIVKRQTKLTQAEVAALPKGQKP